MLEEYSHPLNAGSVMKAHLKNLYKLTVSKHPFALFISRFYGFNGEARYKRDITEYVLHIRSELLNNQPVYSGVKFPFKSIYDFVTYSIKNLGSKKRGFVDLLFSRLTDYVSDENADFL